MAPLTYVIQDCNLPAVEASAKVYRSNKEKEVACCPHFLMLNSQGATSKDLNSKDRIQAHWFVADNKHVWEIWTLEKYINKHVEYYNILNALLRQSLLICTAVPEARMEVVVKLMMVLWFLNGTNSTGGNRGHPALQKRS
jgi:hypothetical protein